MAEPYAPGDDRSPDESLIQTESSLQALLATIPEGSQYDAVRFMIQRIAETFPGELPEITTARVQGWVDEIDRGDGRDADGIRDDIFQYIVGVDTIMSVLGVDQETAQNLIKGKNDGGINFSDLQFGDDGRVIGGGDPDAPVTGGDEADENEETRLSVLGADDLKWFKDPGTGRFYAQYGVPNSDFFMVFEAEASDMDQIFGENRRPEYSHESFSNLVGQENVFFGQSIMDMTVTGEGGYYGDFEDEFSRQLTIGLEEGKLPAWATDADDILALIFVAQSEDKSDEWLLQNIAETESFGARFPGFKEFQSQNNLTVAEGVTGFLEYEAGVRSAMSQIGYDPESVTPDTVGALLNKGYAIETVSQSVGRWKRMQDFAPALQAFNNVLVNAGYEPIESLQDQFDFISGVAPAEIYNLWEASSVSEAAAQAGLGDAFTAEDALRYAARTEGHTSLEDATSAFQDAAKMLLRMRHEVDVGKFGLDQDDIINLSLGIPPASGVSAAELTENINRAVLSAQGNLQARVKPFIGFSQEGIAGAQSMQSLRQA